MLLCPFNIRERELISIASNIRTIDGNPSFTVEQFLETFPQFTNKVPNSVINFYLKLANNSLSYSRWGDSWEMGITLFIAHYLTLYLMSTAGLDENSPVNQVISKSLAAGLTASKSVGSLSKSYEYGSINDDFAGWGTWKLTLYGQQFATIAKLIGKGGSYIW
jgi:hypothetical protein